MNIADAAYHTVHDYPGGSESLAPRIGMSAAVLRNKVNLNNATHKLTLDEALKICDVTDDDRILQAFAAERGKVLVDATLRSDSSRPVLDFLLAEKAADGKLSMVLHEALADGVISRNEMALISSAAFGVQEAVLALVQRLSAASAKAPVA